MSNGFYLLFVMAISTRLIHAALFKEPHTVIACAREYNAATKHMLEVALEKGKNPLPPQARKYEAAIVAGLLTVSLLCQFLPKSFI